MGGTQSGVTILAKILSVKRGELEQRRREVPESSLVKKAALVPAARSLASALKRPKGEPVRVLAEVKRASPSAGPIREGAVPEEIAAQYQEGGAAAVSVLTDESFFDGHLDFLSRVRGVVDIPVLRKDFLIDPYQVVEARANAADAVLLIVTALDDSLLLDMYQAATALGMDALVEVHSEAEAERAAKVSPTIIGVNHRDLKTFKVDTSLTAKLRKRVSEDVVLVGESGIRTREDLQYMRESGADAVLVGESLMRASSPSQALKGLLGRS